MYEWAEEKSAKGLAERGLSFDDAELVFEGPCVTFEDTRFDYDGPRFITCGLLQGRLLVIATRPAARTHASSQ